MDIEKKPIILESKKFETKGTLETYCDENGHVISFDGPIIVSNGEEFSYTWRSI